MQIGCLYAQRLEAEKKTQGFGFWVSLDDDDEEEEGVPP